MKWWYNVDPSRFHPPTSQHADDRKSYIWIKREWKRKQRKWMKGVTKMRLRKERKEEEEGKVTEGPERPSWPEGKGAEFPEEEPCLPFHFPAPTALVPQLCSRSCSLGPVGKAPLEWACPQWQTRPLASDTCFGTHLPLFQCLPPLTSSMGFYWVPSQGLFLIWVDSMSQGHLWPQDIMECISLQDWSYLLPGFIWEQIWVYYGVGCNMCMNAKSNRRFDLNVGLSAASGLVHSDPRGSSFIPICY